MEAHAVLRCKLDSELDNYVYTITIHPVEGEIPIYTGGSMFHDSGVYMRPMFSILDDLSTNGEYAYWASEPVCESCWFSVRIIMHGCHARGHRPFSEAPQFI